MDFSRALPPVFGVRERAGVPKRPFGDPAAAAIDLLTVCPDRSRGLLERARR